MCTPQQIRRYRGRLSGPLLDRLAIHLDVPAVHLQDLAKWREAEPFHEIRTRVSVARQGQTACNRAEPIFSNAQLNPRHLRTYCRIDAEGQNLVERAVTQLGLSARAYDRILRVARTIADLADSERIEGTHVAETFQYRSLDRPVAR